MNGNGRTGNARAVNPVNKVFNNIQRIKLDWEYNSKELKKKLTLLMGVH